MVCNKNMISKFIFIDPIDELLNDNPADPHFDMVSTCDMYHIFSRGLQVNGVDLWPWLLDARLLLHVVMLSVMSCL